MRQLPLLAVGDRDTEVSTPDLTSVCQWFERLSGGCWGFRVLPLGMVRLPRPLSWYAPAGGMGGFPRNSQQLAWDALSALSPATLAAIGETGTDVILLVTSSRLHPHTWRFRKGGFPLGHGWCRRYAVLPTDAPLGTWAHELAHLLLDWPDLPRSSGLGQDCLMATGASRAGGADPSPPCAPFLLRQGWRDTVELDRHLPVAALDVGRWEWRKKRLILERRRDGKPRLLLLQSDPGDLARTRLLARVYLGPGDLPRPVLALVGQALHRL